MGGKYGLGFTGQWPKAQEQNQQQNDLCSGPVKVLTSTLAWQQTSQNTWVWSFRKMNDAKSSQLLFWYNLQLQEMLGEGYWC